MNYQAIRNSTILHAGFEGIPIETRHQLFDAAWAGCGNNEALVKEAYELQVKDYLAATNKQSLLSDEALASLDKPEPSPVAPVVPPPEPPKPKNLVGLDVGELLVLLDAMHVAADPNPRPYTYSLSTRQAILQTVLRRVRATDIYLDILQQDPVSAPAVATGTAPTGSQAAVGQPAVEGAAGG